MPNLRSKTWTTTTLAYVEDAQYWEDHLISNEAAAKAAGAVQDAFKTIEVQSGGSTTNVVANKEDAITLEAGTNITLTATGKNIRINSTGGGGGGGSYTASKGIIISDSDIEADLKDYDLSSEEAIAFGSTANRTYAVGLDSNGDLAVNIPWNGTNENLLDNPWFTINQRGAVTYNTAWGMSVDRWHTDQSITLTVTNSGVQIANSHATDWRNLYMQILEEDYKNLVGRPITMSVMLSDGTIKSGTITAPPMATSQLEQYNIIDGGTFAGGMFTLYNQSPIVVQYYVGIPAGGTLNIRAVKIELGTVSTLGLDTAPNYQQELAKCQRYFLRVKGNVVALNDQGDYDDSFFHEMRANAAFSNGSVSVWNNGWIPITPTEFNVVSSSGTNFVRQLIRLGTSYAYIDILVNYDLSAEI